MIKNFYKDFHKQTLKVQENTERISGERSDKILKLIKIFM